MVLPYSVSVVGGTTANGAVAAGAISNTVDDRVWAMSLSGTFGSRSVTPGEGPIVIGVAHSDYSAAEIEECLEAQASWDQSDLVARERARRKVRTIGIFANEAAANTLFDGREKKVKLGFMLEPGMTLDFWIWNKSGATLTTGGIYQCDGRVYARKT